MSTLHESVDAHALGGKKSGSKTRGRWCRALLASTAALSLGIQNAAWATCFDGTTFPAGGFVVGSARLPTASNWSPNVFTAAAGSPFIPDNSVHEHNDPTLAATFGGHNWVFDQGTALCKQTDLGRAGAVATGWAMPPIIGSDCITLPILKAGKVVNFGDIPYQGDVITPTCNPAILASASNNPFNQLGCSISHGVATTARTATSFMFVAGARGGLFSIPLNNVNPIVGGDAGKTAGGQNYYSAIPGGTNLTNAAVSNNGRFVIVTSNKKLQPIYACLDPLGDPGDPTKPINPNFFVPQASSVRCMVVGNNNLAADLTTTFGPDQQPYFGGQKLANAQAVVVNSFNGQPGGRSKAAWPACIWQNNSALSLADAFARNLAGGCGNAQPNVGISSVLVTQPQAVITRGTYIFAAPLGGSVVQFKVTIDPITLLSQYKSRTYASGFSLVTGLGVADDLNESVMVFSDPTGGVTGQGVVTKLPLCQDIP
jgi:hypothetical protein